MQNEGEVQHGGEVQNDEEVQHGGEVQNEGEVMDGQEVNFVGEAGAPYKGIPWQRFPLNTTLIKRATSKAGEKLAA